MASETAPPPGQPEQWVCMGTRIGTNGKTFTAWLPTTETPASSEQADDLALWYGGKSTAAAGAVYDVRVARRDEDGKTSTSLYRGHTRWVRQWADDDARRALAAEWSARSHAAEARIAQDRLEKKARSQESDPLNSALIPLQTIASKLRNRADKDAFVALVMRALDDAWRSGPYHAAGIRDR